MNTRILIAGGSGYLGQVLFTHFTKKGYTVHCLTRNPKRDTDVYWDGETYGEWIRVLNRADVLINLSGKSVNCRYNKTNKTLIYDSRMKSTAILGSAIKISKTPPKLWINSSTATIYDHSEKHKNTEGDGKIGDDFSMNIAKEWETTVRDAHVEHKTRTVMLRTSIVLGKQSLAYKTLAKLVRYGLGGTQGSGKQMVSWIHEQDFANGVEHIINNNTLKGPINLTSPCPITNKIFMSALRNSKNVSFGISHPEFLLKLGAFFIGTETELILKSRYVIPQILKQNGFRFTYPELNDALNEIEQS